MGMNGTRAEIEVEDHIMVSMETTEIRYDKKKANTFLSELLHCQPNQPVCVIPSTEK